jgi:branched-chain amino acid aminotransferase
VGGTALWNDQWVSPQDAVFSVSDRAVLYGDGVFETLRTAGTSGVRYWEAHYFRLMSSMRLLRLRIPDAWSPEYLHELLLEIAVRNNLNECDVRIHFHVWRRGETGYGSGSNEVDFALTGTPLNTVTYQEKESFTAVVFKEFTKAPGALAGLKGPHSFLYVQAERFALESDAQESLVVTPDNRLLEGGKSNLFLLFGTELVTAPLSAGCVRGILREQVIRLAGEAGLTVREEVCSPFEIQRADEVWLTNAVVGLQTLSHYKQTAFKRQKGAELRTLLESKSLELAWMNRE